jgi:hypothetical protein
VAIRDDSIVLIYCGSVSFSYAAETANYEAVISVPAHNVVYDYAAVIGKDTGPICKGIVAYDVAPVIANDAELCVMGDMHILDHTALCELKVHASIEACDGAVSNTISLLRCALDSRDAAPTSAS